MKLLKSLFSYQCRYCKDTFDHWEKVVKHRTDVHQKEFEALKQAAAALVETKTMESNPRKRRHPDNDKEARLNSRKRKSWTRTAMALEPQNAPVVEIEEECEEIKLFLPPPAPFMPTPSESGPSSMLSPPDTPKRNGRPSDVVCNLLPEVKPLLTPPLSPTLTLAPSTSTITSPPLDGGEIILNMNWINPYSTKAVMYHEMNDDDEIEICIPSAAGSQISVKRHSLPLPDVHVDVDVDRDEVDSDTEAGPNNGVGVNHVVIEDIDDGEIRINCMSNGSKGKGNENLKQKVGGGEGRSGRGKRNGIKLGSESEVNGANGRKKKEPAKKVKCDKRMGRVLPNKPFQKSSKSRENPRASCRRSRIKRS